LRKLARATDDGAPKNDRSRRAGLHRNDGCGLGGLCPTTERPPAATPIYGDGRHDPQRPRYVLNMDIVALARGTSDGQGGHRILVGRLSLWSRRRQPSRRDRAVSPRGPCRLAHPLLHRKSADTSSPRDQCLGTRNARSSRRAAVMAMIEVMGPRRLVLLAAALALALFTMGCAAGSAGPLSSHGVDYARRSIPKRGSGEVPWQAPSMISSAEQNGGRQRPIQQA
jgi:hypothetical protein